jgi:hypothetical protein
MLEFVEQSIRWREEDNCEPLVSALREAAGVAPLVEPEASGVLSTFDRGKGNQPL